MGINQMDLIQIIVLKTGFQRASSILRYQRTSCSMAVNKKSLTNINEQKNQQSTPEDNVNFLKFLNFNV